MFSLTYNSHEKQVFVCSLDFVPSRFTVYRLVFCVVKAVDMVCCEQTASGSTSIDKGNRDLLFFIPYKEYLILTNVCR